MSTQVTIISVAGPAAVQDGGRPGRMHEGMPPGGAMVPELLAAANLALGNPAGAPAIEHFGALAVVADARLVAATDGALVELGPSPVSLSPRLRAGYLAVRGGFDAPAARAGARAAQLRVGVQLGVRGGAGDTVARAPSPPAWPEAPIDVVLGPDAGDVTTLLESVYQISRLGDRVGVRLTGPAVHAAPVGASAPMVRGAIQATPSGELIVLGPDHPTTGGYPVVAVAVAADVGRLMAMRPGAALRFRQRPATVP